MIATDAHVSFAQRCSVNGGVVMSLSNSWRIARNTSVIYSDRVRATVDGPQANEEAAAEQEVTQDRGRTDNTEANPQTR